MNRNNEAATKRNLLELEQRLRQDMKQDIASLKQDMTSMEDRLIEVMRGMQTELLRGFASFSEAQSIRLRKVEADQSNLDAALSGRVAVLERRLLEIEQRLHIVPPPPTQ